MDYRTEEQFITQEAKKYDTAEEFVGNVPEGHIKAYRAEGSGRGVKTDAMLGGTYFFPTKGVAELWAGGQGEVFEALIDVSSASFQDVGEGNMNRVNPKDPTGYNDFDVIVRRDPSGSGKIQEIVTFNNDKFKTKSQLTDIWQAKEKQDE